MRGLPLEFGCCRAVLAVGSVAFQGRRLTASLPTRSATIGRQAAGGPQEGLALHLARGALDAGMPARSRVLGGR